MRVIQNLDFLRAFKELLPKLLGSALGIVVTVTIIGFILALVATPCNTLSGANSSQSIAHNSTISVERSRVQ